MKRRFFAVMLLLFVLIGTFPMSVRADSGSAVNISSSDLVTDVSGLPAVGTLFDGILTSGRPTKGEASLTLEKESGIGSLYFLFGSESGTYTITDNTTGISFTGGEHGFLHDFVDLSTAFGTTPVSITVTFPHEGVNIYELYVYSPGKVPDTVQKWNAPADGKTDLVLFSTHCDDEQLFFAGVVPYYAGQLGYQVQVVYLTDHREDDPQRVHEMLDGLWAVGVTTYPVAGHFPDFLIKHNLKATYAGFEARGYTRDVLLQYVVENLRRFRPMVAVGHDINGEYGHGMHMVYTDLLMEAVAIANDPDYDPASAEKYGLWDTPKTYLHLYEENPIVMDWDVPLEAFGGMSAYEVTSTLGFPCHESQYAAFSWYYNGCKTAREIPLYNPCYYGLYRSTVGEDIVKNDFFENVITHAEAEQLAEEEAKRLEAERLAAEEEAARIAEEQRLAEEKKLAEEKRLAEELRLAEEVKLKNRQHAIITVCAAAAFSAILILRLFFLRRREKS